MGNVQHITRFLEGIDKNLSPCKHVLMKMGMRNGKTIPTSCSGVQEKV